MAETWAASASDTPELRSSSSRFTGGASPHLPEPVSSLVSWGQTRHRLGVTGRTVTVHADRVCRAALW